MISLSEEELLDSLSWSDTSYSLAEFVKKFALPQAVKIERGYDGGTETSTLGYGEVLTLHALRETQVFAAKDKNDSSFSLASDFPYELRVLPQTKDCSLNICQVKDFSSFHPFVKYVEVTRAYYGDEDSVDSADMGEIFEVLDISKPNKPDKIKVRVRNVENNRTGTLRSSCTAEFRPLLDWKKYKISELKTHFGFPIRVRISQIPNKAGEESDSHGLIPETLEMNITGERKDVAIIATTVDGRPDLKYCCEIRQDLDVRFLVASGLTTGEKHYQDIVSNLDKRFNVAKFLATHHPAILRRRGAIKKYDYNLIQQFIVDGRTALSELNDNSDAENVAPPLPPRQHDPAARSNSVPIPKPPARKISASKSEYQKALVPPQSWKERTVPAKPRAYSESHMSDVEHDPRLSLKSQSSGNVLNGNTTNDPLTQREKKNPADNLPRVKSPKLPPKKAPSDRSVPSESKTQATSLGNEGTHQPASPVVPKKPPVITLSKPRKILPDSPQISPNATTEEEAKPCKSPPIPEPFRRAQASLKPPLSPPCRRNPPVANDLRRSATLPYKLKRAGLNDRVGANRELPHRPINIVNSEVGKIPRDDHKTDDAEELYEVLDDHQNPNETQMGSREQYISEEDPYRLIAKIPLDLSCLTVRGVCDVLKHLRMGKYVTKFQDEMIDGKLLRLLKDDDLKSLGVVESFYRVKILEFINGWRPKL